MAKFTDQKRLEEKLAALSSVARRRLYKRAAKMRKAAKLQAEGHAKRDDYTRKFREQRIEDEPENLSQRPKPTAPLDQWALKLLEEEVGGADEKVVRLATKTRQGQIVALTAGGCEVLCEGERLQCILRPEITVGQQTGIAVGDEVAFSTAADGTSIVEEVLPRRSALSRPDPRNPEIARVIAANIDSVVVVASVVSPSLEPNLIDRFLLAIEHSGAEPIICLNKIDLIEEGEGEGGELAKIDPYRQIGLTVAVCSAVTGSGIDQLCQLLEGKICVFVGHSGVGKSSLLNVLDPELQLATRPVRSDGKGRHVTTRSAMYELPGGFRIIDTPGIREFGLWKMAPEQLRWYFPEFEPYAPECKFGDCSHTHEPDCAVVQAVEAEEIPAARYRSYLRILETL